MSADPKLPEDEAARPYVSKVDRRTALIWIGAVGAATAVGAGVVLYGPRIGGEANAQGYGTDPKLNPPVKAPWPRILSQDELQAAGYLSDFILPATATAPAATALGVPDFIDEWVSAPYPDQLKDRPLIHDGLKPLIKVMDDPARRAAWLAALPAATDEATRGFFGRFRYLVVGAYYTTEAGFSDIGYIGNESRAFDPGPSAEVKAHLERELAKLGLLA